jgi:DNA-binding GntR family transcriptional regulator
MLKTNRKTDRFSRSVFARDILHDLRMNIISGELTANHRLVEGQLAKEFGVSRAPIRSALHALEQQGLLRILPNGGAEVIGFSEKRALDLFETRQNIEGIAARTIAANPLSDLTPLRNVTLAMAEEGISLQQLGDLDMEFHYEFIKLTDNWALLQLWNTLSPVIADMLTFTNSLFGDRNLIAVNHESLLRAVEVQDAGLLLKLINEQLQLPRQLISDRYRSLYENEEQS